MAVIEVLVVLVGIGAIALVLMWVLAGPERREAKRTRLVDRNHQELFLLVNDLLAIHDHGYQVVFPDNEALERARKLTAAYREERSL